MNDFLNFFGSAMSDFWSACKWIAPALAIDVWFKQVKVNQRLAEIESLVVENEDDMSEDSDYTTEEN